MTFPFDVRTIALAYGLVNGLIAICMLLISRTRKTYPGFRLWTIASLTLFLGGALLAAQNLLPGVLGVGLSNTAIIAYYVLTYLGLRTFLEKSLRLWHVALTVAVVIGPFSWFAFVQPGTRGRLIVFAATSGAYAVAILWLIPQVQRRYGKVPILIGGLAISCGLFLVRLLTLVLAEGPVLSALVAGSAPSITLLISIAGSIAFAFGLVVLNSQRTEEALRASEEKYRRLVENLGEGVAVIDPEGQILFTNPAAETIIGAPPRGLAGRNVAEFITGNLGTAFAAAEEQRTGATHVSTHELKRVDGKVLHIESTSTPHYGVDGSFQGFLAIFRDITEFRELQESLETERVRLLTVIDAVPDVIFLKDRRSRFVLANKAQAELLGVRTPRDLLGKTDRDFVSRVFADQYEKDDQRVMDTGQSLFNVEEKALTADGTERHVLTTKVPVKDARGAITSLVGISRDVTERTRTEQALNASERKYRSIVQNMNDALYVHEFSGRILDVNDRACQMLGYERGQIMGRNVMDFSAPESQGSAATLLARLLADGSAVFEVMQVRADGSTFPVEVSTKVVSTEGNGLLQAVVRDLTERARAEAERASLEEQLRQAQKMEAVGRLAGGIAHDFNNLLTVITGNVEMCLDLAARDRNLRAYLDEIGHASRRAASLTAQLLAYSRRQILQPRIVNLGSLVAGMVGMLQRLLGEDVSIHTRLPEALGMVRVDPGRIEQVIMNLAINSRDAMPQGGILTIQTSDVVLGEEDARELRGAPPGQYMLLSISDTGTGMDTATLERLFEPFFTTKETGKGTGLGLATVYGIVKQSEGHIACESEVGRGTTFRIYLPRVRTDPAESEQAEITTASPRGGQETILLVEDDEPVRRLVTSVFEARGYTVLNAESGGDALAALSTFQGAPDLLVTDVVMPGMNGKEVAREVQGRHPGISVLFISGYAENAIAHHGVLDPGVHFIQKPFTSAELLRKVRSILDSRSRT